MPRLKNKNTNGRQVDNVATNEQAYQNQMMVRDMVSNSAEFQRKLYNMFLDRRRKIESECGYPATEELTAERYKQIYEREPLAARVVNLFPSGCWQSPPELFETEDVDNVTAFEEAWDELNKNLQGPGFYQEEGGSGNVVWEYLERADMLTGIGHYGAILLGVSGGGELSDPLDLLDKPEQLEEQEETGTGVEDQEEEPGTDASKQLLFVRPLDETSCEIKSYNNDTESPRYGMPEMYNVTLENPGHHPVSTQVQSTRSVDVHWTRIVHLADNLESSEIFGAPRMRVVYNRLYDLFKLYGGSAEMYWLGAFFGLSFETHPQLGGEVTVDTAAMREQIENYQNSLQRYLSTPGMTVKTLAPQISDPTPQIDVQIEALCIVFGVPKRIFMGSERGELSSGQDARAWYAVLQHRRTSYVTPRLIVPFIDRLIQIGVLPMPESYQVKWSDLGTLTDAERAEVAVKQTDAMSKYIAGNVEGIMDPLDYYTRILGFSDTEAMAIIDNRMTTEMASEEQMPMLDGDGNPVVDPITGIPVMETVKTEIGQDRELGGRPAKDEFGRPMPKPKLDDIEEEGDEQEPKKKEEGEFPTRKKKTAKKPPKEDKEDEAEEEAGNAPKKKKKK